MASAMCALFMKLYLSQGHKDIFLHVLNMFFCLFYTSYLEVQTFVKDHQEKASSLTWEGYFRGTVGCHLRR